MGHDFCYTWYLNRAFTIPASSILFILPFCYSKKIDFLKLPSAVGVLAIFYIVGLITFEYFFEETLDLKATERRDVSELWRLR